MIFAKFEICRKSLEKNFELLRVNTSSHMRAKHPFINEADLPSQNVALTTEFRRNKKVWSLEWKEMKKTSRNGEQR